MRKNLITMTCLVAGITMLTPAQAERVRIADGVAGLMNSTDDLFAVGGVRHSNQGYLSGPEHSNQGGTGGDEGGSDDEGPGPRPLQDPDSGGTGPTFGGDRGVVLGSDVWVSTGTTAFDSYVPDQGPFGDTPTDTTFGDDSVVPLPEPTSLLLVSIAGLTLLRRRR